ncbi:MAG: hypothetical protein ACHQKY_14085, partial [Terriglobia bacterium]
RLLLSPESPIVLLHRKVITPQSGIRNPNSMVAPSVAPNNPYLGVMLPLHPASPYPDAGASVPGSGH